MNPLEFPVRWGLYSLFGQNNFLVFDLNASIEGEDFICWSRLIPESNGGGYKRLNKIIFMDIWIVYSFRVSSFV